MLFRYDIILVCDFLRSTRFWLYFDISTVEWLGAKIDMKPTDYFSRETMMEDNTLFLEWLYKILLMVLEEKYNPIFF